VAKASQAVGLAGLWSRSGALGPVGASLAGGLGIGVVLVLASWLAFRGVAEDPGERVTVAIPPGTAAALEEGTEDAVTASVRVSEGDTLVVVNMDSVPHQIGISTLAPGAALEVPITSGDAGSHHSSFNPGGTFTIEVENGSALPWMALGSVLVGLPLGLVIAAVWIVARRLEDAP